MSKWVPFEHLIWREFQSAGLAEHRSFVVAVSGGIDSMGLLNIMLRLRPQLKFKVVHYHHGPADDLRQAKFRDDCVSLLKEFIAAEDVKGRVELHIGTSRQKLVSEDEFRRSRWGFISEVAGENDVVVTAHHLDDLLETHLLKMLRGVSPEGLLGFKAWNGRIFRPFLQVKRSEIEQYAGDFSLKWCEDPTNSESDYLRNWIRNEWLSQLDKKVPGGRENFAKSILRIAEAVSSQQRYPEDIFKQVVDGKINRVWYHVLSKNEQLQTLAFLLRRSDIYDFTTGQLEELRKRLDKNQKELTFDLLGRKWVINASQIMLE